MPVNWRSVSILALGILMCLNEAKALKPSWEVVVGRKSYQYDLRSVSGSADGNKLFVVSEVRSSYAVSQGGLELWTINVPTRTIDSRELEDISALSSRDASPLVLRVLPTGQAVIEQVNDGLTQKTFLQAKAPLNPTGFQASPGGFLLWGTVNDKAVISSVRPDGEARFSRGIDRPSPARIMDAVSDSSGATVALGADAQDGNFAGGGDRLWVVGLTPEGKMGGGIELEGRFGAIEQLANGAYIVAYDRSRSSRRQELWVMALGKDLTKVWEKRIGEFDSGLGPEPFDIGVISPQRFVVSGSKANKPWLGFFDSEGNKLDEFLAEGLSITRGVQLAVSGQTVFLLSYIIAPEESSAGTRKNTKRIQVRAFSLNDQLLETDR